MTTPVLVAALRTTVLCLVTVAVTLYVPAWSRQAIAVSVLLVINVWLFSAIFLVRLWRRYSSDVNVIVFHIAIWIGSCLIWIKEEYLTLTFGSSPNDMRKCRNRKLVRIAVIFLMAQNCIVPGSHFAWLHSLLAYKFIIDISIFIKKEYQNWQSENVVEIVEERASPRELPKPLQVIIQVGKGAFGVWVLFYQTFYVNFWYVITTLIYFFLSQSYLDRPLTRFLETAQLDSFEGLEQYYVLGFMGFVEIIFAFFFMIWSLVQHQQFLMLVALYTNIYSGGREIISNAVSAAFAEWALLAHFERASKEELKDLDDICAICLCKMYTARKTSCKHFFHGHCLRRCLQERPTCPICNKRFEF